MKNPDPSIINQAWPAVDLEQVDKCLYCGSGHRQLAHKDVRDWSFFSAPGTWNYWECDDCHALYLDPRPTEASIGRAYSSYYTHNGGEQSSLQLLVKKIKNECVSTWLGLDLQPRFNWPRFLSPLLRFFKPIVIVPFGVNSLIELPKGRLLDIGCGGGGMLKLAKLIGWEVVGLEIDPEAVSFARSQGLDVIEGGVDQLKNIEGQFDCVICSHVLEHVYQPIELLVSITSVLKKEGTLLLSLPNAGSDIRRRYGEFWRGLEAPRHISIPDLAKVINLLKELGYRDVIQVDISDATTAESDRMRRGTLKKSFIRALMFKVRNMIGLSADGGQSDFIQIIAKRS